MSPRTRLARSCSRSTCDRGPVVTALVPDRSGNEELILSRTALEVRVAAKLGNRISQLSCTLLLAFTSTGRDE